MIFYLLAQQLLIYFTNILLTFPSADPAITAYIEGIPTLFATFKGVITPVSFFFPVHDFFLYFYFIIALDILLYGTALSMWLIRTISIGVIK